MTTLTFPDTIILTAALFGSVYIFSATLVCVNINTIKNQNKNYALNILNGVTLVASGSMFMYCCLKRL
jgi:NADH:ubiquinone oxidoreductase subunit 6 (subunit J)